MLEMWKGYGLQRIQSNEADFFQTSSGSYCRRESRRSLRHRCDGMCLSSGGEPEGSCIQSQPWLHDELKISLGNSERCWLKNLTERQLSDRVLSWLAYIRLWVQSPILLKKKKIRKTTQLLENLPRGLDGHYGHIGHQQLTKQACLCPCSSRD